MIRRILISLAVLAVVLGIYSYGSAVRDPVARTTRIAIEDWPDGEAPVRLLLVSDIHVAGPDMPPSRVERLVGLLNVHEADIVLIAGDFVSDKRLSTRRYSVAEAVEPLAELEAPMGVYAVLGNHDHWRDAAAVRAALAEAGIVVLENRAIQAGPLALIGVDDEFSHHADIPSAFASATGLQGPEVVLAHSPDIVPDLPRRVALVASGHTHCGQVSLPFYGRYSTASRYGERFACGVIDDDGQMVVVGAGLGTSILPIRFNAPPDYWILELGPVD